MTWWYFAATFLYDGPTSLVSMAWQAMQPLDLARASA
jgi:hypothetical protein